MSVSGQLRYLQKVGLATEHNYWLLKSPIDANTLDRAASINTQIITLPGNRSWSDGFAAFAEALRAAKPTAPTPPAIGSSRYQPAVAVSDPKALLSLDPDDIRKNLATIAADFIGKSDFSFDRFKKFCADYDAATTLAARIRVDPPNNKWLGHAISKEFGGGVFGKVYEATAEDGRKVAIKVAREEVRDDEDMLHSFRRGVECMRIVASDNIAGTVRIVDATEVPPSIIMDYIEGITLERAIQTKQLSSPEDRLLVFEKACNVVLSCHDHPRIILHRDLRPSNVMLAGAWWDGVTTTDVVVLDFDLSWYDGAEHRDFVMKNAVALGYLAPEQIDPSSKFSARHAKVDVYGLAALCFFVMGRKHPGLFAVGDEGWPKQVYDSLRDLSGKPWKSVRKRLARLVVSGTSRNQEARPKLSAFIHELKALNQILAGLIPRRQEYWLEELFHRVFSGDYHWNEKLRRAEARLASGLVLNAQSMESAACISFELSYTVADSARRKTVGKYLSERRSTVQQMLESIGAIDVNLSVQRGGLSGKWAVAEVNTIKELDATAEQLKKIAEAFRIV